MDEGFRLYVESLHDAFERLKSMKPVTAATLPKILPNESIYLFSENGRHLYVGRTRKLRQRMRNHCGSTSEHNQAVFAFKLAREITGKMAASYTAEGSRKNLLTDEEFSKAFIECKSRVRSMELRFVGERDPLRQALLEIYVAFVLKTPYNDFDTNDDQRYGNDSLKSSKLGLFRKKREVMRCCCLKNKA